MTIKSKPPSDVASPPQRLNDTLAAVGRRDTAYHAIRSAIISGGYLPAQHLVEADLAAEYGLSKTPIREALSRLENDGLVQSILNRGFVVRVITPAHMRNIYELRELYEGACARYAAESSNHVELATLLLDYNSAAGAALANGDIREVHANFSAFDDAIFAQSTNELLDQEIERIYALVNLGGTMSNTIPGRIERSLHQHLTIATKIRAGDGAGAEQAMRDHIHSLLEDHQRMNETAEPAKRRG